jgi:multiple sugar transport system substrate-binding protein
MLPEGMGDAFLVGKAAMGVKGPWRMSLFYEADFDWGFATIPAGPADQVSYGKPNAEVIFSGSKAKDASWEVLKFLNSEECNWCEAVEIGWGPCLNSVMYSEKYLTRDTPPYDMSAAVPGKLIGIRGEEMSIHADQMRVMLTNELDPVWAGDKKASEVLPDLEGKVNELLASDEVELS